jgi:hypothetical protein
VVNLSNELQTASFMQAHKMGKKLYGESMSTEGSIQLNPYEVVVTELK